MTSVFYGADLGHGTESRDPGPILWRPPQSAPRPNSAREARSIARFRALSALFRAALRLIKLRAGHGRPPSTASCRDLPPKRPKPWGIRSGVVRWETDQGAGAGVVRHSALSVSLKTLVPVCRCVRCNTNIPDCTSKCVCVCVRIAMQRAQCLCICICFLARLMAVSGCSTSYATITG